MKSISFLNSVRSLVLILSLFVAVLACMARSEPSTAEQVGSAATQATQAVQDTGQAALSNVEELWKRIDEKRLKNRTPDELVAWALMGLLVGGLIYRITKLGQ